LVLRPKEVERVKDTMPELLTAYYKPVAVFDQSRKIASYPFLPGRGYLQGDQTFTIYRIDPGMMQ
jgi:hypothetical protein